MSGILGWLASVVLAPVLDLWKAKIAAGTDADKLAADLAAREIEVRRQQMSNWITALPILFLQFGAAGYLVKCWLYDAAFGLGTTEAVTGYTREALLLTVGGMVGNGFIKQIKR